MPSNPHPNDATPAPLLRGAVVGTGHFGRFHARKLCDHPEVDFVGVVDPDPGRGRATAEEAGVPWYPDLHALDGYPDFVTLATPARTHAAIALEFLEAGVHVFVEKPIATSMEDAGRMVAAAERTGCILQVDHQERYFLVEVGLFDIPANEVWDLHVRRMGPQPPRPPDCSAVLDLTIHDLDWLHAWLGYPGELVEASGNRGSSGFIESVHATFRFPGDRKVLLETSRNHPVRSRDIRGTRPCGAFAVDMVGRAVDGALPQPLSAEQLFTLYGSQPFAKDDYVGKSIAHFIHCIRTRNTPLVNGHAGSKALETALNLENYLENHL